MTSTHPPFVVGIGASAGGLEALEQFFAAVPNDSTLTFVVIQHLSPDFKSLMVELLERHTSLPVERIEDETELISGRIYLNPPRRNVLLNGNRFRLIDQEESGGLNMPIDVCFRSMARDIGEAAIAVVLSGTGSDGSRGIVEVRRAGGLVVAQDLESSGFDGMPRSAQGSGVVEVQAPPADLARLLHDYAATPAGFRERLLEFEVDARPQIASLMQVFRSHYGIDFAQYKPATFHRRLERRVQLDGYDDVNNYIEHLFENPKLLDQLYRDVLVEVTEFFRDREAFELLEQSVVPDLLDRTDPNETIRVWVAGCATGEEAYSVAMLLMNACGDERLFKVFATDVHQGSLQIASTGAYTAEALGRLPDGFRERFIEQRGDLFHIREDLRRCVLFAPHDVTKDPPFTKCDLVTCRNMLIYLLNDAQDHAIAGFHFALKKDGVLFLGPSETTGKHEGEFETIDQRWRLYRKLRDTRIGSAPRGHLSNTLRRLVHVPSTVTDGSHSDTQASSATKDLLEQILEDHLPPSILINEHFELVHSFGEARRILVQPKGPPTLDVLKMVEGDLRTALGAALNRALRQDGRAAFRNVRTRDDANANVVNLSVMPYAKAGERMYLVRLEESDSGSVSATGDEDAVYDPSGETRSRISELEEELGATREALKATVEDLESANEELQSTNEELVASNEELQSTNEELHSVNEELYTVNAEHQRKIEELTELSADMDNLLTCTEIGTIFLDKDLRIRTFTPSIAETFHLLDRDVGRPIEHITSKVDNVDVTTDARHVLETAEALETRVQSADGSTFLQRITPYRSACRVVDGVVLTYVAVPQLEASEKRFEQLVQCLTDVVWISAAPDGARVEYVNDSFERIWGVPAEDLYANGHLWVESIVDEDRERVIEAFGRDLASGDFDAHYRIRRSDGDVRWIHDRGQPVRSSSGEVLHFAGVARDVTLERQASAGIAQLIEGSRDAILLLDLEDGRILAGNAAAGRVYGYDPDEVVGLKVKELVPQRLESEANEILRRLRSGDAIAKRETWRVRKDGAEVKILLNAWATRLGGRPAAVSLAHEVEESASS